MASTTVQPTVAQLLERNRALAKDHKPLWLIPEIRSLGLKLSSTLVITCADPRCVPERFFGLNTRDGVVVIRNAGGHVKSELTSILALDHLLTLKDILVIHHTDCGTLYFTDDEAKKDIKQRLPQSLSSAVDKMEFGTITDLEQSVVDDVAELRASPFIRKELTERATGYVFDVKTGLLTEVALKSVL